MNNVAPMVLLHGWGYTPQIWDPLKSALQGLGLDIPIHTPALPLEMSSPKETFGLFAAEFSQPVHLVGWSLGGQYALAYALAYPYKIKSLTLISSTPCFTNQSDWNHGQPLALLEDFKVRLTNDPIGLIRRFSMLVRHGDARASKDRSLTQILSIHAETNSNRLMIGLDWLEQIDLRNACNKYFSYPPLFIHGNSDMVTPFAASEWLQNVFGGTLCTYPGASHALPLTHASEIAKVLQSNIVKAS